MIQKVCVYCGSSPGRGAQFMLAARELGHVLADRGFELVYGGAHVGTMGELANAVLEAGGRVTGVIPKTLVDREVAHDRLTELHVVESMHERKETMAGLADAFVAMPGGLGTLEEVFEIMTWAQLDLHTNPCGFLNTGRYYDLLLEFLRHGVEEGFVRPERLDALIVEERAGPLLERMETVS
ncbi:MAG: TIGR00730 family Rossman fold protein [Spirochaetia bacterium]